MRVATPRSMLLTAAFFAAPLYLAACAQPAEEMPDAALIATEAEPEVDAAPADPLAGEHQLGEDRRVVVGDGAYTVYQDDEVVVEGHYTYVDDTVIFTDHAGSLACLDQQGVYTMAEEDGEAVLRLVEDPCDGRRQDIVGEESDS